MTTKTQPTQPAQKAAGHTPGDWQAREATPDGKYFHAMVVAISKKSGLDICPAIACGYTPEEAEANAQLIAAAPELLQACQRMATGASRTGVDYADDELFKHTMHYLKALDAAISKATQQHP